MRLRLAASAVALALCASCAAPTAEDGLVGLVYNKVQSPASPVGAFYAPVDMAARMPTPSPEVAPQLEYRVSPGDVISVAFFKAPATPDNTLYKIQSGDILAIHVVGQEAMNTDVVVRPDGRISFFQVGDFPVRGKTIPEVRVGLRQELATIMPAADVTVFLRDGNQSVDAFLDVLSSDMNSGSARSVRVKWDGMVSFPLVGEIQVAGKTLAGLRVELEKAYMAVLEGGLSLSLNMVSSGIGNLAVLGEVRQPGLYTLHTAVDPLQAIAMAGGLLDTADASRMVLLRRDASGRLLRFQPNANAMSAPLSVQPNDIIIMPKSSIANVDLFVDQYIRQLVPVRLGFGAYYRID